MEEVKKAPRKRKPATAPTPEPTLSRQARRHKHRYALEAGFTPVDRVSRRYALQAIAALGIARGRPQVHRDLPDGGYDVLRPTKGWLKVSARRHLAAMQQIIDRRMGRMG